MSEKQDPSALREAVERQYKGKLCPFLTMGALARPVEQNRVQVMGSKVHAPAPTAQGCQGPQCMLFEIVVNEQQQLVGCHCALALGRTISGVGNALLGMMAVATGQGTVSAVPHQQQEGAANGG